MLQALYNMFQTEKRVVLAGEEGAGTSRLAHEYTRRFGREYQTIAWINAATNETFLADLYEAMESFALPTDRAQGAMGLFQTLHTFLQEQQQALLVLDHLPSAFRILDTPESLPLTYNVLLITHLENTPAELPRLELTGLDARDGARLVLCQAGQLAEQEKLDAVDSDLWLAALELAREMQGAPLALSLAGSYLRQSGISLRDYLDLFRTYPVRLQLQRSEQQELEVAGEICLSWLEQTHPEARETLQACALLLPDMIPGLLVQPGEAEKAAQQKEIIQCLVTLGLLNASGDRTMLRMHPLLQQLTRQFYNLDAQPQQQSQVEHLLYRLQSLLPALEKEPVSARLRISGHIQHLEQLSRSWQTTPAAGAEVFVWAARLLWEQQMPSQARTLLSRALEIWEQTPGTAQRIIAPALAKLAELSGQLGNYAEAEALAQRAIVGIIAVQGANHPDVLIVLQQLGQYYAAQHKESEARACYEKVLKTAEAGKLLRHPVYSTAKYHLALLAIEQGNDEQAENLLRRVCAVWSRTLGEGHRSAVDARLKLAEVAARLQHWERAYDAYRQALPFYAREMGQGHSLLLEQLERAALVMLQLGKLEEAKSTWQSVLEAREQTRDRTPTKYISCLNGLARVVLAQGQRAEALVLLERARGYAAGRAEAVHSLIWAESLEILAEAHEIERDYRQAEQAARTALEIREQILGSEHLELIKSLSKLAKLKLELGKAEEAEQLLLRTLACYQHEGKPEDMRLAPMLQSLADLETGRERFDVARMYLQRLRAICGLALSADDPRMQEIEQKLAENAQARDQQAQQTRTIK